MSSLLIFAAVTVIAFFSLRAVVNLGQRASLDAVTTFSSIDTSPTKTGRDGFSPKHVSSAAVMVLVAIGVAIVGINERLSKSRSAASTVTSLKVVQNLVSNKLQKALDRAIAADSRNATMQASAYYQNTFSDSVAVFDLTGFTGNETRMDVFRLFLDFAKALKDERFESVVLAYNSVEKFKIDGDYFQKLGRERDWQNPAFTIRSFPENLRTMSGNRAYGEWTGGIIGVLKEQMEDFNDFHDKWYLDDYTRRASTSLVSTTSRRTTWTTPTARVTKAEYDRIRTGMAYSEVWTVIGASGDELSRNVIDGVPGVMDRMETVMYSWPNDDGSSMNAIFQNDRLIQKAQFGLR